MTASGLRAPHLLAGALCAGLAAPLALPLGGARVAVAAGALALATPFAGSRRLLVLGVALALAGAWWGSERLEVLDRSSLAPRAGEAGLARLAVTGPARTGRFAVRVPVRVRHFDRDDVDEPARLELPLGRAPPQGAVIEVVATVKLPREARSPGGFDEAAYLGRQGVHAVLRANSYREVGRRGGALGVVDRLRRHLADSIAPGLDGERGALVAGIVLGEDEQLSEPLRRDFRASGLYHILAVSGQNIAFIVFGMLLLGWALGLPRWAGHLAALVAVLGYTCAVGWQPSVVRAGIAGGLASLAWLASRPSDRWYFLLVGAAVLMGVNPYSLLEPGFQLSFAAVGAIFLLVPATNRWLEDYPLPRPLREAVSISLACGVATAPVLWLHFGSVPVYSVLANALAFPVFGPLLGIALVCAALDPLLPGAAAALAWANGWLAAYLAWCARAVGGLPHAQVSSAEVLAALALAALAAVVVLRARPPRLPKLAALAALSLVLVVSWRAWFPDDGRAALPPPTGLRLTFLDVGQGDSILVQVPEGALLVDQGPPEAAVAEQLRRLGVRRLAALVVTHPHRDHVGGAADVLRSLEVGFVLDPLQPTTGPEQDEAFAAAGHRRVRVVPARVGQRFRLGRLSVRVLWPDGPGSPGEDPHAHAVVLAVSYGETDVLLTADAESDVTLPLRPVAVEILKVAHHGSADDGLARLLDRTRPRIAVISCGRGNMFGHPAASTVAALEDANGLAVYRTDEDGQVVVESDGRRLTVRTEG